MAIGLDGHSKVVGSGTGPHTQNHTCGGVQRLLGVIFTGMKNGAVSWSVGGVTYNGVALTQVAQGEELGNSRAIRTEVWVLVNPPAGSSYQVSVTVGNLTAFSLAVISLSGVDQTTPTGAAGADAGNKAAYGVGLTTTVADAWLLGGAGIRNGTRSWTPGSGVSEVYEQTSGSSTTDDVVGCGNYRVCTAAGAYTLSATASGADRGVMAGVEVRPAAAALAAWFGAEMVQSVGGVWMFQ